MTIQESAGEYGRGNSLWLDGGIVQKGCSFHDGLLRPVVSVFKPFLECLTLGVSRGTENTLHQILQ